MSRVRAPSPAFISRRFRFFRSAFFISAAYERSCRGGSRTRREKVKRFAERVAHRAQKSETLCRKGGTSRSDNAPLASGACEGAKLACGATLSATREFITVAWVLNLLVVPAFLRRGNLRGLRRCLVHDFERPVLFRGIKLQIGEVEFARVK